MAVPASPDAIAAAVLAVFDTLPSKRKPTVRGNGVVEWVPISGVVAEFPDGTVKCVSLATGMKCLPQAKVSTAQGRVLHDSHAEILALRGFNHYLLASCLTLASGAPQEPNSAPELLNFSDWSHWNGRSPEDPHYQSPAQQPFEIREGLKLHLYCSEAPCGDSSMELTMSAQEDPTPWALPASRLPRREPPSAAPSQPLSPLGSDSTPASASLHGRANFSLLSVVRRKPARGDAPPTLSKSCSDKLSLRQCVSLLQSLTALFVRPERAYLSSIVLPSYQLELCQAGFARAFGPEGRMKALVGRRWASEHNEVAWSFRPFQARACSVEFEYSKKSIAGSLESQQRAGPSNVACLWTAGGVEEGLVGGVLQGRKAGDPKGMSVVCRKRMWQLARDAADKLAEKGTEIKGVLASASYAQVKGSGLLEVRQWVAMDVREEALEDWTRNLGDEAFDASH